MSFFKKLFGGDEKKEQPKVTNKPLPQDTPQQKKIKTEKAMHMLEEKINYFKEKEQKVQYELEKLKAKAKQFLQQGKKKQAKKVVEDATKVQKQMESITLRRKALEDKKMELETTIMNMESIDAVQGAHQHIKENQKYSQKLQEIILDSQQSKMHQNEINQKLKDLTGHQEEEEQVDDMLNELMGQVQAEKNIKVAPIKTVTVATQKQKQKNKNQQDEIMRAINEL